MKAANAHTNQGYWTEQDSEDFIDYGDYFIPYRQEQRRVLLQLLSTLPPHSTVVDLCGGNGQLGKIILDQYPQFQLKLYELSDKMLQYARQDLGKYGKRFEAHKFNLADHSWRQGMEKVDAFISSLAIHHLSAFQKKELFADLFKLLKSGGGLLIADVVLPAASAAFSIYAQEWDAWVRQQADELNDNKVYQKFSDEKWNFFQYPEDDLLDKPSTIYEQLSWLGQAGFEQVDVFWMKSGIAVFGGYKL